MAGKRRGGYTAGYRNKRKRNMKSKPDSSRMSIYNRGNLRTGGYMGLEKKFFDASYSAALTVSTDMTGLEADPATLLSLNCPAQGDGEQNRDGRQIAMDSIMLHGTVLIPTQSDQTAADILPDVMIALVLDTQTNAAQMQSEDVFVNPSATFNTATVPFVNLENTHRFRILAKHYINAAEWSVVPAYDGTNMEQQGAIVSFKMWKSLKGLKTNFISGQTTSVVAAIADNSIHVVAVANSTSTAPVLTYQSRLRFYG